MNFLKKTLLFISFIFIPPLCFSQDYNPSKIAEVETIESTFRQEISYTFSTAPFVCGGKMVFQKPDKIRWEYLYPDTAKSGFLFEKDKFIYWKTNAKGEKAIADLSKRRFAKNIFFAISSFLNMDMPALETIYDIELLNNMMVFYSKQKAGRIERIEVYFKKDIPAVSQIIIFHKNGDKTTISFDDVKINEVLPENAFNI
ncbi:MAG: outer membrane lipoprotein carrier protein LolA [Elusimicrobiota bacterium]|jgi:outer membrane lipoprotein-sorting protein|nr:outer membrane lipoprotein carrier protein LolA [Elusimicrobiota bacterium]